MSRHSITEVFLHVVWATRDRRAIIRREDDGRLASLLNAAGRVLGCEIIAAGNASNHVHVIAQMAPKVSVAELAQRLKGRSSYLGGWKWQSGYFAQSIGAADLAPLTAYVLDQRNHHDDSHPAEVWVLHEREPAEGGL